jgi:hypothetical protein
MFQWISRRTSGRSVAPAPRGVAPVPVAVEAGKAKNVSGVIYPPQDPGLPVHEPATLVSDQGELMAMLRLHAAATPDLFAMRYESPIRSIAETVNVLPGSATASFSGAGGLFRAAVETGFSAFRASDGRIFTGSMGVEDRHRLEGRWRYVCFVAGLLYPLGGALAAMSVVSARGQKWSCELETLTEFARAAKADEIFVSWLSDDAVLGPGTVTATFALKVLGRGNIEWLNAGSPELVRGLINIITGAASAKDLIATSVVKDMWQAVNARELARRHENYGRLTVGSNVSPYIIDALISLARKKWVMNKDTLYVDRSGMYLEWPKAGRDIIDFCRERAYPGIPENEAALLAILTAVKVVSAGVDGVALMPIANVDGEVKSAIQLLRPALLLGDDETLESAASGRPVLMAALEAADPIQGHAASKAAPAQSRRASSPTIQAAPVMDQIDPNEILAAAAPQELVAEQPAAPTAPVPPSATKGATESAASMPRTAPRSAPRSAAPKPGTDQLALVEGPEVRYCDLLPGDVAALLPGYYQELLGRLVHAWKTRKEDGFPRKCDQGAAFEYSMLADLTRDPTTFLTKLGQLGMLFVQPTTPNKMLYPVPVALGSHSTAKCFILADHAMRRLAL